MVINSTKFWLYLKSIHADSQKFDFDKNKEIDSERAYPKRTQTNQTEEGLKSPETKSQDIW